MPNAAVLATQLTDHSARPFTLTLGNMDVIAYADFDSIEVIEEGPGAVSQCSFHIVDPTGVVPVPTAGSEVWMWDNTTGTPMFGGYISEWNASPYAGGVGRSLSITALGLEVLLDWGNLPSTDVATYLSVSQPSANPLLPLGVQYLTGQFGSFGFRDTAADTEVNGDFDEPIGTLVDNSAPPRLQITAGVVVGPGSLREAIGQLLQLATKATYPGTNPFYFDAVLTVDFYRGLRMYFRGQKPDDYTDLTIDDSLGAALASTSLNYEVHPGDVVRAVYVTGLNPAGSGWVVDGTGIIGQQAVLNNPNSTNADRLAQIGTAYLQSQAPLTRGTVSIQNYAPSVGTVHPGSSVVISDANVGLSAQSYVISTITKTFTKAGKQNWTVAFGGRRPSAMSAIRRDFPSTGQGQQFGTFTDAVAGFGTH